MKLAYDLDLRRPACVLVAVGFGADAALAQRFPVESWLLAPTPGMRVYEVTEENVAEAIRATEATLHSE